MAKVVYTGYAAGHKLLVEALTFDAGTPSERKTTRWAATGAGWSKGSLWTERTAEESLLAMVEEVRSCHPRARLTIVAEPGSGAKLAAEGLEILGSAGPRQNESRGGAAPADEAHDPRTGLLLWLPKGDELPKGCEMVPRLGGVNDPRRARILLSEDESLRYYHREDRDAPFVTVDQNTGKTVKIRRASCGLRCRCDATVQVVRA